MLTFKVTTTMNQILKTAVRLFSIRKFLTAVLLFTLKESPLNQSIVYKLIAFTLSQS